MIDIDICVDDLVNAVEPLVAEATSASTLQASNVEYPNVHGESAAEILVKPENKKRGRPKKDKLAIIKAQLVAAAANTAVSNEPTPVGLLIGETSASQPTTDAKTISPRCDVFELLDELKESVTAGGSLPWRRGRLMKAILDQHVHMDRHPRIFKMAGEKYVPLLHRGSRPSPRYLEKGELFQIIANWDNRYRFKAEKAQLYLSLNVCDEFNEQVQDDRLTFTDHAEVLRILNVLRKKKRLVSDFDDKKKKATLAELYQRKSCDIRKWNRNKYKYVVLNSSCKPECLKEELEPRASKKPKNVKAVIDQTSVDPIGTLESGDLLPCWRIDNSVEDGIGYVTAVSEAAAAEMIKPLAGEGQPPLSLKRIGELIMRQGVWGIKDLI